MAEIIKWNEQEDLILENGKLILRDTRDWIDDIECVLLTSKSYNDLLCQKHSYRRLAEKQRDKLHRRNMQIKDLEKQLKQMTDRANSAEEELLELKEELELGYGSSQK